MEQKIQHEIFRLLAARGADKSICPSEVARSLWPTDWRPHMEEVRQVAAGLARAGRLRITQGERTLSPDELSGPLRLRWPLAGPGENMAGK